MKCRGSKDKIEFEAIYSLLTCLEFECMFLCSERMRQAAEDGVCMHIYCSILDVNSM